MSFNKLRVEGSGVVGDSYRFFLNDVEITSLYSVAIMFDVDMVNRVELKLYADVEMPEEIEAMLAKAPTLREP